MKSCKLFNPRIKSLLKEKASHSPCTYRISAIGFDAKGDILCHVTNNHSKNWNVLEKYSAGRAGTAVHSERRILERYKGVVKSILIMRIGHSGEIRPIHPCQVCQKVANKYGVKIYTIDDFE